MERHQSAGRSQLYRPDNYKAILTAPGIRQTDFFTALKNTTYFALGVVPMQTILSLLLAVVVNQSLLRFKSFFRTTYFPSITSSVAISLMFLFFYQKSGLVNQVLGTLTFGAWEPIAWMADPRGLIHIVLSWFGLTIQTAPDFLTQTDLFGVTLWSWISGPSVALTGIMIMNTWTTIGTMMIIFLAALQDIPNFVYEASQIDGASP